MSLNLKKPLNVFTVIIILSSPKGDFAEVQFIAAWWHGLKITLMTTLLVAKVTKYPPSNITLLLSVSSL